MKNLMKLLTVILLIGLVSSCENNDDSIENNNEKSILNSENEISKLNSKANVSALNLGGSLCDTTHPSNPTSPKTLLQK